MMEVNLQQHRQIWDIKAPNNIQRKTTIIAKKGEKSENIYE